MKGVFFRQRLIASCLVSLHTSSTFLLTSTLLLLNLPEKAGAANITNGENPSAPQPQSRRQGEILGRNFPSSHPPILRSPHPISQAPVTIPVVPFELQNTPQRFQGSPQFDRYRIGPTDVLSVIVQRFPDLSINAVVTPEGNIVVPLLGTVPVRGLTLEEAQEKIRLGLNRYVIDPIVTVGLATPRQVQISITGAITRPGFYALPFPPRLSNALLVAGGSTGQADLRQIRVRRFLLDGSFIEQRIDLFTPLAAGDPLPDLRLEDGDTVIIPQLEVGNDPTYDRQLVARSNISKPTINVRVLSYPNQGLGTLVLPSGSNFLDAFTNAVGNIGNADLSRVALIRFDPERGRAIVREINGKKALFGDAAQNVPLRDNDVIVVGRNLVGRITFALNTFTQPFRDILGFLLFFRQLSESATDLFNPTGQNNNNN